MSGERVLVVDDEPIVTEVVQRYLVREGFQVDVAADGVSGLKRAREGTPDLVVLDLMLPELDGLEVCRQLRGESSVPIIMLTAKGEDADKILGLGLGADDYLTKPFSPGELIARVKAVLRRSQAGALALNLEPGSLGDLVSDTLEALQPQAARTGLRLRGHVDDGLPPILMDAARVQRVLYNLVQNAIRHTPADGTIQLEAQDEPNVVRVDVVDTGEGIAPENLPRIFDRFYRGEKSRVRGQGGAGLGLAIAKGLVEAQGGRIWARSAPGQGTRFSFVLPKVPAAVGR